MRESLGYYMIPISVENMNGRLYCCGAEKVLMNVSSNGYYGYQPQIHVQNKQQDCLHAQVATPQVNDMEIEFNSWQDSNDMQTDNNNVSRHMNRKRGFESDEAEEFNKKRKGEGTPQQVESSLPSQKVVHLRKPTHNIPDLPRCIMGHYF